MHYIVTGCNGKLGGRTAELMLQQVAPADLTFTCPFLDRLDPEKKARWESLGVKVCQANYDDPDEMVKAFAGGDRIFIVSAVTIGEIRVRQHKNVVDAAIAAGVKHITYTSFLGASDPAYAHVYVPPDHTATEAYIRQRHEEFFAYLDSMHIPRTATGDYSRSPVPWCGNDMVTNEGSIAEGLMDVASDDVELLTGRKPMTARELAQNYSYIWENHVTNWKDIR